MVITIIYHLLHAFLQDHKKFPKTLHLQTDNCGRENKNRYVFTFLSALVELGVFSTITMDFLLVGHTGMYWYAYCVSVVSGVFSGNSSSDNVIMSKRYDLEDKVAPMKP